MKNKEIGKKCGDSTLLSGHRNIGSSDHRNLNGIYTDVFGGLRERKKSLEEIFEKNLWPMARNQLSEFKRKYMSTWIVFFYIHIFL